MGDARNQLQQGAGTILTSHSTAGCCRMGIFHINNHRATVIVAEGDLLGESVYKATRAMKPNVYNESPEIAKYNGKLIILSY